MPEDNHTSLNERLSELSLTRKNSEEEAGGATKKTDKVDPKAPENEYYEIRPTPGKGYGCFAIKPLKRGTRILADSPLLIVPIANYFLSDIEAAFEKLTPAQKALYFTLHSGNGQDPKNWPKRIRPEVTGKERQRILEQHYARVAKEPSLISIFQTNCMELGDGAAVFPHAARFNHSCNPNAVFNWNPAIQKETIHIMNDVKEGEEITLSYCDATHDKTLRAWELKHYGFSCDCPACTGDEDNPESFAHKSAVRRYRIAELERETRYFRGPALEEAMKKPDFVKQLLELASLHVEEGDHSVRLVSIYLDLALVCEAAKDYTNGRQCAANAVRTRRECLGEDFPDHEKYTEVFLRINTKYMAELKKKSGGA